MSDASQNASGFVKDLGDAARRNPISAALIGMGVLWMVTGGKGAGRVGDLLSRTGLDRLPETAKDVIDDVGSRAGSGAIAIKTAANSSLDAVRERGAASADHASRLLGMMPDAGSVFETARDNLADVFRTQPLALGAIGLAIGAGMAAALPTTEVENTYLGEASESMRNSAAEIAGHQIEKGAALAAEVSEAAMTEARRQGLTPDGARAAASDIAGRISRVVDAATTSSAEDAS